MCVWAVQGKGGTERDARDFGVPDGKQQTPRAAPEEARAAGAAGWPRWATRLADRARWLGAADVQRRRVQATEGGQRFAHVLRKMSPGAAVQQVSSAASGSGHLRAAALSPAPHFRLRCSRPISERRRRLAGQLDGMTRARMCSGGVEQPPLALSIESGAADALCLAAPRVRRHSPPPLLILCWEGRYRPHRCVDTRDAVGPGGGEATHTAAMWVMYPSYGCPDPPLEIRDRSRCAALGQRQDATERPDVQNAPVRTTAKMCRLPQSLT